MDMVLRRKALGAEALLAQWAALREDARSPTLNTFHWLIQSRRSIAERMMAGPDSRGPEEHERLLQEMFDGREGIEAALLKEIAEKRPFESMTHIDGASVAAALPEGSALIELLRISLCDLAVLQSRAEKPWGPPRYLAFVLRAEAPDDVTLVDLGEAEECDRAVKAFRDWAAVPGYTRDIGSPPAVRGSEERQAGELLRALIFDPLLPALAGCKRLLIAPDGELTRVPFEALPIGAGRHLIDDYLISYVSVGRDVLRFGETRGGRPGSPLVLAAPDYDLAAGECPGAGAPEPPAPADEWEELARGGLFRPLEGTRIEGERIAGLLGEKAWLGADVLEGQLKRWVQQNGSPWILHLATHGFLVEKKGSSSQDLGAALWGPHGAPENPLLRSGLALAGANTRLHRGRLPPDAEDGLLTAEDVVGLDFFDTEMVVLSACGTGLGEVEVGEGVLGLRRSFALAGARTLVMTLWKVPDVQTQGLMEDFYKRVLRGQHRAEALREAQLALKALHPHAFFWGAFICQGYPGPLPSREISVAEPPAASADPGPDTSAPAASYRWP